MMQVSPLARKDSLIVKNLPEETLVYDRDTDQAHCLNLTATVVWKNCDGKHSVAELREALELETKSTVPEEVVLLALEQLEKFKLLDHASSKTFQMPGMNRRELVRRVGFAALALPLIVSIAAPPAHAQASGLPPGECCGNPNQCASDSCLQNPVCVGPPSTKACA